MQLLLEEQPQASNSRTSRGRRDLDEELTRAATRRRSGRHHSPDVTEHDNLRRRSSRQRKEVYSTYNQDLIPLINQAQSESTLNSHVSSHHSPVRSTIHTEDNVWVLLRHILLTMF